MELKLVEPKFIVACRPITLQVRISTDQNGFSGNVCARIGIQRQCKEVSIPPFTHEIVKFDFKRVSRLYGVVSYEVTAGGKSITGDIPILPFEVSISALILSSLFMEAFKDQIAPFALRYITKEQFDLFVNMINNLSMLSTFSVAMTYTECLSL